MLPTTLTQSPLILRSCIVLWALLSALSVSHSVHSQETSNLAPKVMVLGDSLSSGFGLLEGEEWPVLMLERSLREGAPFTLINASISGETTSGGLSRLPQLLKKHQPNIVLIELGANDGLRGQSLTEMRRNLKHMIELSLDADALPLLIGMKIPPNYGKRYSRDFEQSFPNLSNQFNIPFVPFILKNIAGKPELNLADGIHPNQQAQTLVLENIWPSLKPMILNFDQD